MERMFCLDLQTTNPASIERREREPNNGPRDGRVWGPRLTSEMVSNHKGSVKVEDSPVLSFFYFVTLK